MGHDENTVVQGQHWPDLPTPTLGEWEPRLTVTVVLPARDCQPELDRTLASLAGQSYPAELFDVVVVDDASEPPLTLPDRSGLRARILRRDEESSHGSGAARRAGASATDADVVLFLDADMVAERRHVEAHARWHHVCRHAVVLGRKWFVDFAGISADDVAAATTAEGGIAGLLAGRKQRGHDWQEQHIADQDGLTRDADDAFLAVVGASVSVRRSFYEAVGGFAGFGLRGIVDTEFGYRAYTGGALLVPDDEALAYHQGARNFAKRGSEIKLLRTGLAANHLPIPMFRKQNTGRRWVVPSVGVVVPVGEATPELVQTTVDSVLGSAVTDLTVTVVDPAGTLPAWVRDYFTAETRVAFVDQHPTSSFPCPFTVVVPAGLMVAPGAVGRLLDVLARENVGLVRTDPAETEDLGVEAWRTRALCRITGAGHTDDVAARAAEVFGERWAPAAASGVRPARYSVTKQGMLATE